MKSAHPSGPADPTPGTEKGGLAGNQRDHLLCNNVEMAVGGGACPGPPCWQDTGGPDQTQGREPSSLQHFLWKESSALVHL